MSWEDAVPKIRRPMIDELVAASYATTQKYRNGRMRAAFAYGQTLGLLLRAATDLPDGIDTGVGYHSNAREQELVVQFFSGRWPVDIMGRKPE